MAPIDQGPRQTRTNQPGYANNENLHFQLVSREQVAKCKLGHSSLPSRDARIGQRADTLAGLSPFMATGSEKATKPPVALEPAYNGTGTVHTTLGS